MKDTNSLEILKLTNGHEFSKNGAAWEIALDLINEALERGGETQENWLESFKGACRLAEALRTAGRDQ